MNEEVRMPIETVREGNKITKTCVEDVYKIINRVYDGMNKAYNKSEDLLESVHKTVGLYSGELIVGKGTSQPCLQDAFDEEIGNNIAFMKMKLNVNIKKHNLLCQIYNQYYDFLDRLDKEIDKIDGFIKFDLNGVRKHNPDYLHDLESKLGIKDEI